MLRYTKLSEKSTIAAKYGAKLAWSQKFFARSAVQQAYGCGVTGAVL